MSADDIVLIIKRDEDYAAYHRQSSWMEGIKGDVIEALVASNPPPFVTKGKLQEVIDEVETLSPYPEYGYECVGFETVILDADEYNHLSELAAVGDFFIGMDKLAL